MGSSGSKACAAYDPSTHCRWSIALTRRRAASACARVAYRASGAGMASPCGGEMRPCGSGESGSGTTPCLHGQTRVEKPVSFGDAWLQRHGRSVASERPLLTSAEGGLEP